MNFKSAFVVAAIALVTTNAFAADPAFTPTPGESLDYPYFAKSQQSSVGRSTVRREAIAQDANHGLTGEIGFDKQAFDNGGAASTLTRAQVRADVLAARADGTLPPTGEDPNYPESARDVPSLRFQSKGHPTLARFDQWVKSHVGGSN